MPVGPRPDNSTHLTYRNRGITVMGPARINKGINDRFDKEKSFMLF